MSSITKLKNPSVSYNGFGGMDKNAGCGENRQAEEITNFRIGKDGSLEKRQGFRPVFYLGQGLRAIYGMTENGRYIIYTLIEDEIVAFDYEAGERRSVTRIPTVQGSALFFGYRGKLYLADGEQIYRISSSSYSSIHGYVPLIGREWSTCIVGEPYEARNILTRKVRISYVIPSTVSEYLNTKYPVETIDAVYINGGITNPLRYSIETAFTAIKVSNLSAGDKVEAYLTLREEGENGQNDLAAARFSAFFGGTGNSRIFLGGRDSTVYVSEHVSGEMLTEAQRAYPNADELYFPEDTDLEAGGGVNRIRAMVEHLGRILIFTDGDIWQAIPSSSGKELYSECVSSRLGCISDGGAVFMGDMTVSLGKNAVWALKDGANGFQITDISEPIQGQIELSDCGVFYDRGRDELWIYDKTSDIAMVYNASAKAWYKFRGIHAEQMLDLNGEVGFINNGFLYVLDKAAVCDQYADNSTAQINASYTSALLDFGTEKRKNLYRLKLRADLDSSAMTFQVIEDGDEKASFDLSDEDRHSVIDRRICSGRFKSMQFRISFSGLSRPKIHSLTLVTR